jgi:hypothetical protein
MDQQGWMAFVVALISGMTQLVLAVATMLRVLKVETRVDTVAASLNGRLDMLLQERELRLRAEHQAEVERQRAQSLLTFVPPFRPEAIVKTIPSSPPERKEGGS